MTTVRRDGAVVSHPTRKGRAKDGAPGVCTIGDRGRLMSEVSHQIGTGIKQIIDLATAPKRLKETIEKFGLPGEKVRYTVYARYHNPEIWLDKPQGLILITSQRFLFIAIRPLMPPIPIINRPWVKGTNEIVCPLNSLESAENVIFRRRARVLQVTISNVKHTFFLAHLIKLAKPELVDETVQAILHAKAAVT